MDIKEKLHSFGYTVNNKGYIFKYSQSTKHKEVAGQLNKAGVYFYAENVHPFKPGQNTYKDIFGSNGSYTYEPYISPQTNEKGLTFWKHIISFDNYLKTTKPKNQFGIYAKRFCKEQLKKDFRNVYDIRGIKTGSFSDATLFPYINYKDEFLTAKVVKYNTNTGKRIKKGFSNTWFHAEKSIKKELGIKDKISASINCFFGEHLVLHNEKPVVIVEAEKTAILLSELFKNTVFLATGGIGKLDGLNYDFLIDRKVYLFPDNNALEWFKIAEKRGWWISEILENYGRDGEDVADYLFTTESEERSKIWWDLYEELWQINEGLDVGSVEATSLHFEHKKETSFNYCTPFPVDLGLTYYQDTAKGDSFKGKHFQIFEKDFNVLTANIDFNKKIWNDDLKCWEELLSVDKFLFKLEKVFRIVKHLNGEKPYRYYFTKVLQHLLINSNHKFNISYVENALVPLWDNSEYDITSYYKTRNWRFASSESISKKDFRKFLNNDKKLFSTQILLYQLAPFINKREFIDTKLIGLHDKKLNPYVWQLVKDYNKKIIGCTTSRNYESKLKVSEYLNWWVNNVNDLEGENVCTLKFNNTYYNTNIINTFKIPPVLTISENTSVHRKIINEYLDFKPDLDFLTDLKEEIKYYVEHPQEFNFKRVNGRISIIPNYTIEEIDKIKRETELPTKLLSQKEAFDYVPDLSNSVLNCTESEAIEKGTHFLSSWILFHNPDLDEKLRYEIVHCPTYYLQHKEYYIDKFNFAFSK